MAAHAGYSRWIEIWFALDAVVALAPPLYWWADGRTTPILGLPEALFYFLAVDVLVAASLVAAYLAGVVLLAASMGHTDGNIQAYGTQIANDLIGNYVEIDGRRLILAAKGAMLVLTILASWLATLSLPALFSLAVLAYQGIIQLAVPQFGGIFWRRGTKEGATAGMLVGFAVAVALEVGFAGHLPFGWGLTSGCFGLAANLAVYFGFAWLLPQSDEERHRVDALFATLADTFAHSPP